MKRLQSSGKYEETIELLVRLMVRRNSNE